jgi:hypothetical protein
MFCDSHYISRFAAFFIDARAKRSFVESFRLYFRFRHRLYSIKAAPKRRNTLYLHGI